MADAFNEISGNNRRSLTRKSLTRTFIRFARDDNGATSIEYGLICSLIFLAIVASVNNVATATSSLHTKISGSLN